LHTSGAAAFLSGNAPLVDAVYFIDLYTKNNSNPVDKVVESVSEILGNR
jgi:hypothetical protein